MRHDADQRRVLSLFADLLDYPVAGLAHKALECEALLGPGAPDATALLREFRIFAEEASIGKLEEVYSGFFDLNPICHPYLGYQLFGENYKRSSFLLGLKERYRADAFEATPNEIPDRLSIVLRFVAHDHRDDSIDELVREGLLPALGRMTAQPESRHDDHDGQAEFDGDTGIERKQLDGHGHRVERKQLDGHSLGEVLAGGFVLETGSDGDDTDTGQKREHPYRQVLEALRMVLLRTWRG